MTTIRPLPPRSRVAAFPAAVIVVALLLTACTGDDPPAPQRPGASADGADGATAATVPLAEDGPTIAETIAAGFEQQESLDQLDQAMTLSYLQRRFSEQVDLVWADPLVTSAITTLDASDPDDPLRVFRRFIDPDAEVPTQLEPDLGDGETSVSTDALVAPALWCDRIELPGDYFDVLDQAQELGGYDLTHALGSVQLLIENGCVDERRGRELTDRYAVPTAALLETEEMTDLELEACALLAWAGRWDLVPADLPERVAASQLSDGGWRLGRGDEVSHPHANVWGLRCALELEHGAASEPVSWVPGGTVPTTD